jgi:prefoldin subunit 5
MSDHDNQSGAEQASPSPEEEKQNLEAQLNPTEAASSQTASEAIERAETHGEEAGQPGEPILPTSETPVQPDVEPHVDQAAPVLPGAHESARVQLSPQPVSPRASWIIPAVVLSVVVLVLSTALSLSLLGIINGGLLYPTTAHYSQLNRQVEDLNTEITSMQQDVSALRTRLDGLEKLSGRVGAVETQAQAMQKELDSRSAVLDQMQTKVKDLDQQTQALQTASQKFQAFLDGLRSLLSTPDNTGGTK